VPGAKPQTAVWGWTEQELCSSLEATEARVETHVYGGKGLTARCLLEPAHQRSAPISAQLSERISDAALEDVAAGASAPVVKFQIVDGSYAGVSNHQR
jgi:hypothetical protein